MRRSQCALARHESARTRIFFGAVVGSSTIFCHQAIAFLGSPGKPQPVHCLYQMTQKISEPAYTRRNAPYANLQTISCVPRSRTRQQLLSRPLLQLLRVRSEQLHHVKVLLVRSTAVATDPEVLSEGVHLCSFHVEVLWNLSDSTRDTAEGFTTAIEHGEENVKFSMGLCAQSIKMGESWKEGFFLASAEATCTTSIVGARRTPEIESGTTYLANTKHERACAR